MREQWIEIEREIERHDDCSVKDSERYRGLLLLDNDIDERCLLTSYHDNAVSYACLQKGNTCSQHSKVDPYASLRNIKLLSQK